jgi:hypothetical protein
VARALFSARRSGDVLGRKDLVRALEATAPPPPPPNPELRSVIKILFLAANPAGEDVLNIGTEIRDIEERLRGPHGARFELATEFAVRRQKLIEKIEGHKPTIVHFSGHGTPDGELIFETGDGAPAPAPIGALETIFRILAPKGIRCVVLNACYSARQAEAIARHVDWVVGTGRAFSDEAAIEFSSQFYSSISRGSSIGEAFDLARAQLDLNGIPESHTPRLLCRAGVDPRDARPVVWLSSPSLPSSGSRSRGPSG